MGSVDGQSVGGLVVECVVFVVYRELGDLNAGGNLSNEGLSSAVGFGLVQQCLPHDNQLIPMELLAFPRDSTAGIAQTCHFKSFLYKGSIARTLHTVVIYLQH